MGLDHLESAPLGISERVFCGRRKEDREVWLQGSCVFKSQAEADNKSGSMRHPLLLYVVLDLSVLAILNPSHSTLSLSSM